MSAVLLAASLTVIAGGVASIAGRRPLLVAVGTGVLLAAAPFVGDPVDLDVPLKLTVAR
jgi:hypothetical protein